MAVWPTLTINGQVYTNVTLTPVQLAAYAGSGGFTGGAMATMVAICLAESSGNTLDYNVYRDGSVDRGVCQINNAYHPEVSDACAYDPGCALKAAYTISNHGTNFGAWTTYTSGAYRQFLTIANAATSGSANNPAVTSPQYAALAGYMRQFYSQSVITQGFGCTAYTVEPAPPAGVYCSSGHYHYGIDFGEALGAAIPSVTSGQVIFSGYDNSGFGNHVIVRDSANNTTTYGHMQSTAVQVGQNVSIGTTLGYVDSTGNSTGNHLHIQIQDSRNVAFDPWPVIQAAIAAVAAGNTVDNAANASTWPPPGEMINNKLSSIEGFDGIAQAIAGFEQMVSYQDNNPISATIYNLQAFTIRGITILIGVLLILASLRVLSEGQGVIGLVSGLPEAGINRLPGMAAGGESAPAATGIHGARTLGPVAEGLEIAA